MCVCKLDIKISINKCAIWHKTAQNTPTLDMIVWHASEEGFYGIGEYYLLLYKGKDHPMGLNVYSVWTDHLKCAQNALFESLALSATRTI